jgi:hypothetical protein
MQKTIDVDMYIRGYKARQQYRQRRVRKAFINEYIKPYAMSVVLLAMFWFIAVGILSI